MKRNSREKIITFKRGTHQKCKRVTYKIWIGTIIKGKKGHS